MAVTKFGVEEELLVIDPATRAVVPAAASILARARMQVGARASAEMTRVQVEVKTDPCASASELYEQLRAGRAAMAAAAQAEGMRLIASGSPVLMGDALPPPLSEGPRYAKGLATFRGLHDEAATCATQVHVEMPDLDRALRVSNHLRPDLPVLLALAANSPYWAGRDTGYASWRSISLGRWPVAGPPPYFTSVAHYEKLVASLIDVGALVDKATIFWDVRPSAHLPTLEVRVTDVPITSQESALIAALVRALVLCAEKAVDRGDRGPAISAEMLRAAYWRAARDGLDGHGIDLPTGRLVPAVDLVARLVGRVAPALGSDRELVISWLGALLERGSGASRQRRVAANGKLSDTVDYLMARTVDPPPVSGHMPVAAAARRVHGWR
ncbi:glutamate--cysteine ligase [Pendulispora albinea]|uniref:Putative glutamate--cysteine ligase 2 n=1 Tax=Pendulispora albinea TaxID=2741071 RepID=A0ABZ2LVK6_9BACT